MKKTNKQTKKPKQTNKQKQKQKQNKTKQNKKKKQTKNRQKKNKQKPKQTNKTKKKKKHNFIIALFCRSTQTLLIVNEFQMISDEKSNIILKYAYLAYSP